MNYKYCILIFILFFCINIFAKELNVVSPNGSLAVHVSTNPNLILDFYHEGELIISNIDIGLHIKEYGMFHKNLHTINESYSSVNELITPPFPLKFRTIRNNYQQLMIDFEENISLEIKVFDNGFAYRFNTKFDHDITIKDELLTFNVNRKGSVFERTSLDFYSGNEGTFDYYPISFLPKNQLINLPILFNSNDISEQKFFIAESNIHDYPGMSFEHLGKGKFKAVFPNVIKEINAPEEFEKNNYTLYYPTKTENYKAKIIGNKYLPWRVFGISNIDKELISNQLVYLLADSSRIKDAKWVKAGKFISDKWHNLNLIGVNFKVGRNTNTYLYYIDFSQNFNLDYITIDSGWYIQNSPLNVINELNINELSEYAQEKNIGIILNVSFPDLVDNYENILEKFKDWGVDGVKIDQIFREDQEANFQLENIIQWCALHNLIIILDDYPKPNGWERTYPNLLSIESVAGNIYNKIDGKSANPVQSTIIPFSRMLLGPMNYVPGVLNNATKDEYQLNTQKPMSYGTRCHQLAMYVLFESGFQGLAESPSSYELELETLEFISQIPNQWDTTIVLAAKLGNYLVEAKKSNNDWYISGLNDWTTREVSVDFSFLPKGSFEMTIIKDGINASKNATDYRKEILPINNKKVTKVVMASGGGFCAKIAPKVK